MKCGFCGKELTEGAEFCPECGMILSLGDIEESDKKSEPEKEAEIPEYTPNVFKAMDFEEEEAVPAMELEVNDAEEEAVVVEAIPEYTEEPEADEPEEEEADLAEAEAEPAEELFVAPEYDPNAEVSAEFMQKTVEETDVDAEAFADEYEAKEESIEATDDAEVAEEAAEEEFTPPEYEAEGFVVTIPDDEETYDDTEDMYPEYNGEAEEVVPEEKLTEDESLFAALFEDDDSEKIEDITPVDIKPEKTSKKNVASVAVLLIVLVAVVITGGYVFKNVLPKLVDTNTTTTAATGEKADATTEAAEKTTTKKDKTTTEKTTEEKTTAEKETTTEADVTEDEVTTTEKETTTKAPETTEPATEGDDTTVVLPSSYNVDEVAFFPVYGDISIKAGPSTTSADLMMHPYGYPVYAYAKEGSYYYVDSPILDFMGWVSEKDIEEYIEVTEATTAAPEEDEEEPAGDTDTSYTAVISSAEGLNFRTGPGSEYEVKYTIPGGFRVRVTKQSTENPGWVYVTVEDDSYPYGSPSGWVSSEFLS